MFERDGILLRQVNEVHRAEHEACTTTGLYSALQSKGMLIAHEDVGLDHAFDSRAAFILRPVRLPFISYPYEWCFSQLRDAALVTLQAHRLAFGRGFGLRDATSFNVQFQQGRAILIDTLSFGRFDGRRPWDAYRQYCEQFLAPLLLMAYRDARLGRLVQIWPNGVPLSIATRLLPLAARLRPAILAHVALQARLQAAAPGGLAVKGPAFTPARHLALLDSLESLIRSLRPRKSTSSWLGYPKNSFYAVGAGADKERRVRAAIERIRPRTVWDLGANEGIHSQVAASLGADVVSIDLDVAVVERSYATAKAASHPWLPLCVDLLSPSPRLGWGNEERANLEDRGPADLALALALQHHFVLAGVPPARLFAYLRRLGRRVLIEYVPRDDPAVQALGGDPHGRLPSRQDFEDAAGECFDIECREAIEGSNRILYILKGWGP